MYIDRRWAISTNPSYKIFAILAPDKIGEVLPALDRFLHTNKYQATLGTNNPVVEENLQNKPPGLTLLSAGSIAEMWEKEGLSSDMAQRLNYALIAGAGVLFLKNLTEAGVNELRQELDEILRRSSPDYLKDRYEAPLLWAIGPAGKAAKRRGVAQGHSASTNSAIYSPDGSKILTLSKDATARVWDVATGKELFTLRGRGDRLHFAMFSPDSKSILASARTGPLKLWDAQNGHELLSFPHSDYPVVSAMFSPNGLDIAVVVKEGDTDYVHIWDARSGQERLWDTPWDTTTGQEPRRSGSKVLFSPLGDTFATAIDDKSVEVWTAKKMHRRLTLQGRNPLYSPRGGSLLLLQDVGSHSTAIVADIESGKQRFTLQSSNILNEFCYNPNGRSIAGVDAGEGVMIWTHRGEEHLSLAGDTVLGFGPKGKSIATLSYGVDVGQIKVWTAQTGEELLTVEGRDAVYSPADESRLLVATDTAISSPDKLTVINGVTDAWDVRDGRKLFSLSGSNPVYSPDGKTIATTLEDGRAMLWDASSGQAKATLGQTRVLARLETGLSLSAAPGGGGPPELPGDVPPFPGGEEKPPGPPSIERYAEVGYQDSVKPEQWFDLSVGLVRLRPEDISLKPEDIEDVIPIAVQFTQDVTGQNTGARPVGVRLYTDNFECDRDEVELPVYEDKDTDPVIIRVRAKAGISGLQQIDVVFFQEYDLGQVVVIIDVVEATAPQSKVNFKHMAIRKRPNDRFTDPPDVIIRVNLVGDSLDYDYEWVQRNWPPRSGGKRRVQGFIETWFASYYSEMSSLARSSSSDDDSRKEDRRTNLRNLGASLYEELFTREMKEFYKLFAPEAKSVLLSSNEPWIPWEVIRPFGTHQHPLDEELSDFLCARFQFSRWLRDDSGYRLNLHPTMNLRRLRTIIPSNLTLRYIDDEQKYLQSLSRQWPRLSVSPLQPCTVQHVRKFMAEGNINLFHFATHGGMRDENAPATIFLDDDEKFVVRQLTDSTIDYGLSTSAPLIFMNACHAGRPAQGPFRLEGWAMKFLSYGCSGFIGANWEIDDELAVKFAKSFYQALRAGMTIAQAFKKARLDVKEVDEANSTWLAYSLYAHPNMKVIT